MFPGTSGIISHKAAVNKIQGIKVARGSPRITHLFFADDSLVFFKANKANSDTIKDCLSKYEKASGQQINFDKSVITFSKPTPQNHIRYIKEKMRLSICQGHELYLGLPTFVIRSKRIQFGYLRDRVAKELDGWKNRFFSEGGRKVYQSRHPSYPSLCYILFQDSQHYFKGD